MSPSPVTPEQMKKYDVHCPDGVNIAVWRAANLIADDFKAGFCDHGMVVQFAARIQQALDCTKIEEPCPAAARVKLRAQAGSDIVIAIQLTPRPDPSSECRRYYKIPDDDQDAVEWTENWDEAWLFGTVEHADPTFDGLVNYRQHLKDGTLTPPKEVIDALLLGPDRPKSAGWLMMLDQNRTVLHSTLLEGALKAESFHDSGQA